MLLEENILFSVFNFIHSRIYASRNVRLLTTPAQAAPNTRVDVVAGLVFTWYECCANTDGPTTVDWYASGLLFFSFIRDIGLILHMRCSIFCAMLTNQSFARLCFLANFAIIMVDLRDIKCSLLLRDRKREKYWEREKRETEREIIMRKKESDREGEIVENARVGQR